MKIKKFRWVAIIGVLCLATFFPQEALAYKYYIRLPDGMLLMFRAKDRDEAQAMFDRMCCEGRFDGMSVDPLSRPNGGYMGGADL